MTLNSIPSVIYFPASYAPSSFLFAWSLVTILRNYTTVCKDSNQVTLLRNLKCLKPGLKWFYFFETDLQIFLQPSYVKAEGKSLCSSILLPKLHMCDTYVSVMYLWVYMIDIAFM